MSDDPCRVVSGTLRIKGPAGLWSLSFVFGEAILMIGFLAYGFDYMNSGLSLLEKAVDQILQDRCL